MLGVPAAFGAFLYSHRVEVVSDQLLRERGEGDSALTNAHIQLRRRYRKIYEDYRPQFVYYKLVLMLRKLLFACVVVLLNRSVESQSGLSVALLLVSYIFQQRCCPFVRAQSLATS